MDIDTLISKGIAYGLIDRDDLVGYSEVELENLRQCQGVEKIPDQFQDFLKRMGKSNSKIVDCPFMNIYTYEEVKSVFLREKYDPFTMSLFPVRDSFVFLYAPDGLVFFLIVSKEESRVYVYEFGVDILRSHDSSFFDFFDSYLESYRLK